MLVKTTDGTPDAVKVACPVWSGGKGRDYIKALPITIGGAKFAGCADPLRTKYARSDNGRAIADP